MIRRLFFILIIVIYLTTTAGCRQEVNNKEPTPHYDELKIFRDRLLEYREIKLSQLDELNTIIVNIDSQITAQQAHVDQLSELCPPGFHSVSSLTTEQFKACFTISNEREELRQLINQKEIFLAERISLEQEIGELNRLLDE